ncbi:aldo/keto reductase [Microbacterium sp. ISL-103]|uniref:aldo/keto reductase n=1 Tax=Microbacterium sp. ISL-103 TaxID=2819156 RepID=UPI001BE60059|nr:aldo/keto reductase [Microbacterium sp. ISL-103]MBT2474657.1 aldo/keto reductase [Microbacterium sp. ISL-103]
MTLREEIPLGSVALGTAGFAFGGVSDRNSVETIRDAVKRGIRLIDTARAYTRPGEESTAEALVARALRGASGPDALVATKGGHWREGDQFPVDGRPATLRAHCEASLRILDRDQIDLFYLHHVDPRVPLEESVAALSEMRRAGLIRHVGLSNVTVDQLDRASRVAKISAVQNRLSLGHPDGVEIAWDCARRGVVFMAYSPLGGAGAKPPQTVSGIAARIGVSTAQVQLAWLRVAAPGVVPIIGATRSATVLDSVRASELELSRADLAELARSVHHAKPLTE